MTAIPAIGQYMTVNPQTMSVKETLTGARAIMNSHRIRHLPVMRDGQLVGILSQRDIHLIETLKDINPDQILVEDAYSRHPFTVNPSTPLSIVCSEMATQKYGCALVTDGRELVGIFTWIDALTVFSDFLKSGRLASQKDVEANI